MEKICGTCEHFVQTKTDGSFCEHPSEFFWN